MERESRPLTRRKPSSGRLQSVSPLAAMIYTDGSCINNGRNDIAIGGIGVFWPNHPERNISEPFNGLQTAERAEIRAACRGIQQAIDFGYKEVTVHLDCLYVKDVMEKDNYRFSPVGAQRDAKVFDELRELMKKIKVNFEWVPSENNPADQLAKQASRARSLSREPIDRRD